MRACVAARKYLAAGWFRIHFAKTFVKNSPVTAAVRAGLCAQWSYRARAENEASYRFRGLETRLRASGIGGESRALAKRAIADEERHREACDQEAQRWGGAAQSHSPVCLPPPTTGETANRRLEFEVVTLCCIAETLNSIYLAEIVRSAVDQELKLRTRDILSDEVSHSRLGWFFLARSGADLAWLSAEMPRILRSAAHEELLESRNAAIVHEGYGLYAPGPLAALFRASVEEVVLPGLANHGLDPGPALAWLGLGVGPASSER